MPNGPGYQLPPTIPVANGGGRPPTIRPPPPTGLAVRIHRPGRTIAASGAVAASSRLLRPLLVIPRNLRLLNAERIVLNGAANKYYWWALAVNKDLTGLSAALADVAIIFPNPPQTAAQSRVALYSVANTPFASSYDVPLPYEHHRLWIVFDNTADPLERTFHACLTFSHD